MKKETERRIEEQILNDDEAWYKRMFILEDEIEVLKSKNIGQTTIFNDIHKRLRALEKKVYENGNNR